MFNPEKLPTVPEIKKEDKVEKAEALETQEKLREYLLLDNPLSFEEAQEILQIERPNKWPAQKELKSYINNEPQEVIRETEQHRAKIEKEGRNVDKMIKSYQQFENFSNFEIKPLDELSHWDKIKPYFDKNNIRGLEKINVIVIDDENYWETFYGSNLSKSIIEPKTIVFKKEVFEQPDISKENLSWIVHEVGHSVFYDVLDEDRKQYMENVHKKQKYTETAIESIAFQAQLDYLKSAGKTKEECLAFLQDYTDQTLGKNQEINAEQKTLKQREFKQLMKYLENVYSEKRPTIPEMKEENKIEKAKTFETWQKLVVGEEKAPEIKIENLDNEQFKELLYKRVEDRLDKTIKTLGVEVDESFVEKMNKEEDNKKKAEMQKEIIKSVAKQLNSIPSIAKQLNSIPSVAWAFFPKEIEKEKKLNCSGSALLCGHILNKIGIKTEYGKPTDHAINFAELADGTVEYVDARNNVIEDAEVEEEEFDGVKIRKINHKDIEYKLAPSLSKRDAIHSILENLEALKGEAKKKDGNPVAKEIYENNKSLLDAANYEKLSEKLYPELTKFFETDEWKEEKKRIAKLRGFHENMEKINERFEKLVPEEQKKLRTETTEKKESVLEFLISDDSDTRDKDELSEPLIGFLSDIKKGLTPLKNWNREEYNKFIENLVRKF